MVRPKPDTTIHKTVGLNMSAVAPGTAMKGAGVSLAPSVAPLSGLHSLDFPRLGWGVLFRNAAAGSLQTIRDSSPSGVAESIVYVSTRS